MIFHVLLDNDGVVTAMSDREMDGASVEVDTPFNIIEDSARYVYRLVGDTIERSENLIWAEWQATEAALLGKAIKMRSVDNIIVTTSSGKQFDGDEVSQERLSRAVTIAAATGQTTTSWKLATNEIAVVTVPELVEALALSGQAMSDIWLAAP